MLSESPSQSHSFPLQKVIFPSTQQYFFKTQQPLHSPKMQPAKAHRPPTSWLVKYLVIHMKKLCNSDWVRAVQFKCNTSAKSVIPVQKVLTPVHIAHRNSGL